MGRLGWLNRLGRLNRLGWLKPLNRLGWLKPLNRLGRRLNRRGDEPGRVARPVGF